MRFWSILVVVLIINLLLLCSGFEVAKARSFEVNIFSPEAVYDISSLTQFENELGVKFNSCKWYSDWSSDIDIGVARRFSNHGAIPELTWEPQINGVGVSYSEVIAGNYDVYINSQAQAMRSFSSSIRISLAPEMNSEWSPWGIGKNGNNNENHKLFWRYVVQKFRDNGVNNVDWIWTPNIRYYGDLYSYTEIYPGDGYVDYVGLDGYNWGTTQEWSVWQSFREVFQTSYNELTGLTSKNILIMETASTEIGGNKASWIINMFSDIEFYFPRIKGVTWFNINKETDWRINSSETSKIGFIQALKGASSISSVDSNNDQNQPSSSNSSNYSSKPNQPKDSIPTLTINYQPVAEFTIQPIKQPVSLANTSNNNILSNQFFSKVINSFSIVSLLSIIFGLIIGFLTLFLTPFFYQWKQRRGKLL